MADQVVGAGRDTTAPVREHSNNDPKLQDSCGAQETARSEGPPNRLTRPTLCPQNRPLPNQLPVYLCACPQTSHRRPLIMSRIPLPHLINATCPNFHLPPPKSDDNAAKICDGPRPPQLSRFSSTFFSVSALFISWAGAARRQHYSRWPRHCPDGTHSPALGRPHMHPSPAA